MPASAIPINPTGGAPSQSSQSKSLPDALKELLALRLEADALDSEALQDELQQGSTGPLASTMSAKLEEIAKLGATWKSRLPAAVARKVTPEEEARGLFIQAWALGRVGQYTTPDSKKLAAQLEDALALFQRAANLLELPPPPTLAEVPSVTRPAPVGKHPALLLPEQSAWVGDLLAEWARAQTTLAFALLLNDDEGVDEGKLSDILELSCRRNVQALFTPLDPYSPVEDDTLSAGTVMGNARLIKDMSLAFPFASTTAPSWHRRIEWATHCADVVFVQSSMSANRLVDAASASATILQSSNTSPEKRNDVRKVLEATVRRLVPFEKSQGTCLLDLGRVMLEAIECLYLGKTDGDSHENGRAGQEREETEEVEEEKPEVPENELVKETRQVFIRAAGLFENAYASFRRSPVTKTTSRDEQRLLQRLETTYILLGELDNSTPEVQALRRERVERALWINDRLLALGSDEILNDSDDDDPQEDDDDEDGDERDLVETLAELETK